MRTSSPVHGLKSVFDQRYVEQAWLAYLHIVPGGVYLFLVPLQLAYRISSRHYAFHRRLGLVLPVRAIRRDDIVHHRRWMIRAFAIGIGTTRIWLALCEVTGLGSFESSFGPGILDFVQPHVAAGELWLRAFPNPPELTRESPASSSSQRVAGTPTAP